MSVDKQKLGQLRALFEHQRRAIYDMHRISNDLLNKFDELARYDKQLYDLFEELRGELETFDPTPKSRTVDIAFEPRKDPWKDPNCEHTHNGDSMVQKITGRCLLCGKQMHDPVPYEPKPEQAAGSGWSSATAQVPAWVKQKSSEEDRIRSIAAPDRAPIVDQVEAMAHQSLLEEAEAVSSSIYVKSCRTHFDQHKKLDDKQVKKLREIVDQTRRAS